MKAVKPLHTTICVVDVKLDQSNSSLFPNPNSSDKIVEKVRPVYQLNWKRN